MMDRSSFCGFVWTNARSMQNYELIRPLASIAQARRQTLMIKRSPGSTIREVMGIIHHAFDAAYRGQLWIIERGIVGIGYDDEIRWRPDILAIPQIKDECSNLALDVRVMLDASHSCGKREYVAAIAKAGLAAGADGIMVEVFDVPEESPSDSRQALSVAEFRKLMEDINGRA